MAFQNISDLDLGTFLQVIYSKGIFHQTSRDYSDFDMIKMNNVKIAPGRQYDFQLSTSLAPASTQRRNPGQSNRPFPKGFRVAHEEYTAVFKEIQTTIDLDGQLLARAQQTPEKYAEVWATQAELSLDGARRVMASEIYRDGTGALVHIGSTTDLGGGRLEVTLAANDRNISSPTYGVSHAGWCESEDILIAKTRANNGTTGVAGDSAGTAAYWSVKSVDPENGKVVLQALDANFAELAAVGTAPADTEVLFRYDQQLFPAFADIDSSSDLGSISTPLSGYEALASGDGRTVHGMKLEGALAGSQIDAQGSAIDVKFIEQAMNKAKRRVGPSRYTWKKMCTSYATRSALIESKETDRRFVSVKDNDRGSAEFNYIHGETQLRLGSSEYCPEDAIWMLPEVRSSGEKVMEYVGDEMKVAKYGNMADFHLKVSNGEYVDGVQQFMRGVNLLLCKHPAAIASIVNFTNQ